MMTAMINLRRKRKRRGIFLILNLPSVTTGGERRRSKSSRVSIDRKINVVLILGRTRGHSTRNPRKKRFSMIQIWKITGRRNQKLSTVWIVKMTQKEEEQEERRQAIWIRWDQIVKK